MTTLFRVESTDVKGLNALQLTKLLKLLLHLEARTHGIAGRAVDVALNINVQDGGEDGRIQWKDGPSDTNFLPCRMVQFQVKATEMGPADCAKEITTSDGNLKPMIEQVIDRNGAYIMFTSQELNAKQMIRDRVTAIRSKLSELGKAYADSAIIEIYDAAKIEGWINKYVSAIVTVLNWVGRPSVRGLKTWDNWGQHPEYADFPFITDDLRQTAIATLKDHLSKPRKCGRIIGLSGLGKTRLAFEIFRDANEHGDLSKRVVYVDYSANPSVLGWITDLVQLELEGIVVIDNCELSLHEKLKKEIQRTGSNFSLLTIDFNLEKSRSTETIQLKPLSDSHIKQMLKPVYGEKIPDLDRIVSFAQGFPQMAVLLANARLGRESEMGRLTGDDLAKKMLWGVHAPIEEDEKILRGCALFDRFGFEEAVSVEYEFIAKQIVGISIDRFYECVKRFEERGIIDRRGRFARLVPKPLAIRLAAEWWRRTRRDRQIEVINTKMPDGLVESFCDQISRLDFLPEVKELVEDLCGKQGPFGQAEVILSDRGSRLFRALVEVNPEATSRAFADILRRLNEKELHAIRGDVRRNLVWALEKLCFHEVCFEESANSLLLLASAENEAWGNNATAQFKQLFRTFLSGTEAPPELRLKVIDAALVGDRESIRKLGIDALDEVIDTYGKSRMVGAEYQGSGEPLQEWRPKIWEEAFQYWDQALTRLCELVMKRDPLSPLAKRSTAHHIRDLMQHGRVDSLDKAIKDIVRSDGPFWPEAFDKIKDTLRYDGNQMPVKGKAKLEEWILLLTPQDLANRLKLYISAPPYEHEEEEGHYKDVAAENAKKLAIELASNPSSLVPYLKDLLAGEQRMGYWFAKNLVQAAGKWEPLLTQTISRLSEIEKPNISLLLGILNGIFNLDQSQWEKVTNQLSGSGTLIPYYAEIVNSGAVTEAQLNTVVDLIAKNWIKPTSANTFIYGRPLEQLTPEIVCRFVLKLAGVNPSAAWVALNILSMYCHKNLKRWDQCKGAFGEIVIRLPLEKHLRNEQIDMYHWSQTAERLVISEGTEFAKTIAKIIVDYCSTEKLDFSDLWHYVQPLLRKIFQLYGQEVWPIFSEAIKSIDSLKRYRLSSLLNPGSHFEKRKPSVLAELPEKVLIDWCFEEPDIAPQFVADATDVFLETEAGVKVSPRALFLIDNFGDDDRVLSALSMNMGSFGWTGSIVPHYQKELAAIEPLKNHSKARVREWVTRRITWLSKMIDKEKRRDEEHDWGIY